MAKKVINSSLLKVVFLAVIMTATTVSAWAEVYVAQIGDDKTGTKYETLEAAITAANQKITEGESSVTIEIINNCSLPDGATVNASVTLNVASDKEFELSVGTDKTLTISDNAAFTNAGTLTLTGAGKITSLTNSATLTVNNGGMVTALSNAGTLTVNNGKVTTLTATGNTSTISADAQNATITTLNVGDGATTTISGKGYSNITGTGTVNLGSEITDALTIESGSITIDLCGNNITGKVTNAGTLTLNDSGKTDDIKGAVTTLENTGTITVNCQATTFENSGTATIGSNATVTTVTNTQTGNLTVDGTISTSLTNTNGTVTINADVQTMTNTGGNVTINAGKTVSTLSTTSGTIVANGTVTTFTNISGETTISGAGISAIGGQGTIKLGDDITQALTLTAQSGTTFTLDLNGKNATGTITNASKLEVKDSYASAGTITALTSGAGTETTITSGNVTTLTTTDASAKVNIKGEAAKTVTTLTVTDGTKVTFQEIASQEALQAAVYLTGTSTIELGRDVTGNITIASGNNITLDPKGYNLDGTVSNAGTLELKDAGNTSGEPATTTYGTITALANTGTLTVTEGNLTTLTATSGTAEVRGGTITNATASGSSDILKVSGGNITGTLTTSADNIVTVTGGTIYAFAGEYIIQFPEVDAADELTQALKAPKADVKLTKNITADAAFTVGNNATIDVNAMTITTTAGNTFNVNADGNLTFSGSGSVNCGAQGSVAVNNEGTFELHGPAVASATLNGTQTVTSGTLTSATLATDKDINVTGGTVTALTAVGNNSIATSNAGTITTLTANGNVNISGNGFKNLAGHTETAATITLTSDVKSNLTVTAGMMNLALGDHSISEAGNDQNTVTVNESATLTITGTGNITNSNAAHAAVENKGATTLSGGNIATVKSTAGTLTVDGANVTTLTAGAGTTTISGGTVTNLNGNGTVTLGADLDMDLTLTDGTVTLDLNGKNLNATTDPQKTVTVNSGATLTINGTSGSVGKIDNHGTTIVQNGTVTNLTSSGNVTFSGGTVNTLTATGGTVAVNASGIETLNAKSGSTVTIDTDEHKPTNLIAEAGAIVQIGSTTYDFGNIKTTYELTQALAMTSAGSLKLGDNITGDFVVPGGSNITIDLNNHSLTASSDNAITAIGDVRITNAGTIVSVSVESTGSFTLDGVGTVTTLNNNGTTTVNHGTVKTISSSTGTLNVSGGTVTTVTSATGTTTVSSGSVGELTTTDGTTTISGGAVTTLNATGATTVTISDGNVTTATAGKTMTVSGGTIGTLTTTTSTVGDDGGLTVTAGTITKLNVVASSKAHVSGGTIATLDVGDADLTVTADGIVSAYRGDGGENVKLPSYNISDGNAGHYPGNFVATTAKYTRDTGVNDMNKWGTACLPFDFKYNIGGFVQVYSVSDVTGDALNLNLYATDATITAGTPFVFHIDNIDAAVGCNETTQVFKAENAMVDIDAHNSQTATGVMLVGVNTATELTTETNPVVTNCYYISENTFHRALKKLTVPAYRAYLQITSSGAKPMTLSLQTGDADGIESLFAEDSEIIGYYDLNGVRHAAPQKGMNIVKMKNGKSVKMMIK